MRKISFVLSSLQDTHAIKRINEFVDNGYDVKVYGYSRAGLQNQSLNNYSYETLGEIDNTKSYFHRLIPMIKAMKTIKLRDKTDFFYYFGLDVAILGSIFVSKRYIYEECDLTHTYFSNKLLIHLFEYVDKLIIKKSKRTIFTSDGFLSYHFDNKTIDNIIVIPNKLDSKILTAQPIAKSRTEFSRLKFAFIGIARYESIFNFAKFIGDQGLHEFHFYGNINNEIEVKQDFEKYKNIFFHGTFMNPFDLPEIYSNTDFVIATYDIEYENVRYAEPNKLYEAIYFECPIIVSKNTFLADKVKLLDIGWSVDPLDDNDISKLIDVFNEKSYESKISKMREIPKIDCVCDSSVFFSSIDNLF